jgi:hypothetical protein
MRPLTRITPVGPAHAYRTFAIAAPKATHTRLAGCEEVGCIAQHNGWVTSVDEATELGQRQAHYIRTRSGRPFKEQRHETLVDFVFPPGTECFAGHRVKLDRPEIYIVRDGDWRGNPTGENRRHARAADWVEDFSEHQDRINSAVKRG